MNDCIYPRPIIFKLLKFLGLDHIEDEEGENKISHLHVDWKQRAKTKNNDDRFPLFKAIEENV